MEEQVQAGGIDKAVTVILTSCGRFDLLRITIESFLKFNTYHIKEFIVSDDSDRDIPDYFKEDFPFIKWLKSPVEKNQIASLDFLWSKVTTPYCAQIEDDWEFTKEGFIEKSMQILEADEKILMVWLIQLEYMNVHPVEWGATHGVLKRMPQLWSWHRFNPSLKRKADYDLIAPFSKHTSFNPAKPWKAEADISQVYHKLGFTAAILPEAYMHHIGNGRHVGA